MRKQSRSYHSKCLSWQAVHHRHIKIPIQLAKLFGTLTLNVGFIRQGVLTTCAESLGRELLPQDILSLRNLASWR